MLEVMLYLVTVAVMLVSGTLGPVIRIELDCLNDLTHRPIPGARQQMGSAWSGCKARWLIFYQYRFRKNPWVLVGP